MHLNFADLKEIRTSTFEEKFIENLETAFSKIDIALDKSSKNVDTCFERTLLKIKDEQIVLLIDEYDAPLTASLDNKEEFDLRRSVLASFFSKVKDSLDQSKFRFIFITGVTRYSQTSIFSAFNNLEDLSFKSEYSTLVGYTQEELEYYFKDYIENAAVVLNKEEDTTEYNYDVIVQKLKEHYDGYSFDSKARTHVYNPWSILNFLKYPKDGFKNYWLDSGAATPTLLVKYLNSRDISTDKELLNNYLNLDFTKATSEATLSPAVVDISDANFNLEAILYQAGYLSIKEGDGEDFSIGIPNLEVKKAYATIILKSILNKEVPTIRLVYRKALESALDNKDFELLKDTLNKYLNEFSYNFYKDADEIRYREIIKIILTLLSITAYSEVESSKGRCDLQISYKDKFYVIEFKLAHHESELNDKLNDAIAQIKDRKYHKLLRSQSIVPLAIVILDKKAEDDKSAIHEIAEIKEIL